MATDSHIGSEASEREVLIARIFDAPRELVFKAWTDSSHLVKWFGPRDFTASVIKNDVRSGGAYEFHMRGPNYDDHWKGTYREVVPPERLSFTWPAGADSVVTLTFEDLGGKTRLTLHHGVFPSVESRDQHNTGWTSTLDCLADYLKVAHE